MAYEIFIFELFLFAGIVIYLSYYFGKWKKQSIIITIAYTFGWYIPMLIVGVLPIDIASTFYFQNKQNGENAKNSSYDASIFVDMKTLNMFWHFVFWSSQLLTWVILPLMQSYSVSGEFTVLRKLRAAFIDNIIYYGSFSVVFICILIYLLVKKTVPFNAYALKVLIITTSNTWGLFLIIIFLGYGLVEVPRAVWRAGFPRSRLRLAYFQISKHYVEYIEIEEELKTVLQEVREMDAYIPPEHHLRSQMNVIVAKVVDDAEDSNGVTRRLRSQHEGAELGAKARRVTKQRLAKIHKRLIKAQHQFNRAKSLWREAIRKAAWFEDIDANFISESRVFEPGLMPALLHGEQASSICSSLCRPINTNSGLKWRRLEWYWKCRFRPLLLRLAGCFLAGLSVMFVWSECTFFIQQPVLSIVAICLRAQSDYFNYKLMSFVSFAGLGYLGLCTFFTAYRLRVFNYYRLVPNHHTDTKSLIFYGMLFSRLTPALCLNFLCLAHLDSHVIPQTTPNAFGNTPTTTGNVPLLAEAQLATLAAKPVVYETAFTAFMGHLDVVPFIADGFNIYFPIAIVFFCLFTFLRLGSRLLHCLGIPQFVTSTDDTFGCPFSRQDPMITTDSIVEETIEDGKMLLRRERTISRTRRQGRLQQQMKLPNGRAVSGQHRPTDDHDATTSTTGNPRSFATFSNSVFDPDAIEHNRRIDSFNEPAMEYSEENLNSMFNLTPTTTSFSPPKRHQRPPHQPSGNPSPLLSRISNSLRSLLPQSTSNRSQLL